MARRKGDANVIVEVLLDAQSRKTSDVEFERDEGSQVVNVTDRIRRVMLTDNVLDGGFSFQLVISEVDWDFWKRLLAGQEGNRFQIRLTYQAENTVERTEWRTCYLDVPTAQITSRELRIVLDGADRRLELQQIGRFRSYSSQRIADIVQAVASRHNLSTSIADMDDVPEDWLQPGISDWDFLKERILSACATRDRGDVHLWVGEDTLNLRPIDYAQTPIRSYALGLSDDRVQHIKLTMNNRAADRKGAARVRSTGFDFDSKEGMTFEVDVGQAASAPALQRRLPRAQSGGLVNVSSTSEKEDSLERGAFRKWGIASTLYCEMELFLKPDFTLPVGSMVVVTAESDLHQSLFIDGPYPVTAVTHEVSGNIARTRVTVARREAQIGVEDAPGTRVGQQPTDGYLSETGEQGRKVVQVREA